MRKTPKQAMLVARSLAKQLVANCKSADVDVYVAAVAKSGSRDVFTKAHTSMLGGMVVILDVLNRMGVDDATQNAVRAMVSQSLGVQDKEHSERMAATQDGEVHGESQ